MESYYLGQSIIFKSLGAELAVEDIYHKVSNGDVKAWLEAKTRQDEMELAGE